jgi:hypothetical protein
VSGVEQTGQDEQSIGLDDHVGTRHRDLARAWKPDLRDSLLAANGKYAQRRRIVERDDKCAVARERRTKHAPRVRIRRQLHAAGDIPQPRGSVA